MSESLPASASTSSNAAATLSGGTIRSPTVFVCGPVGVAVKVGAKSIGKPRSLAAWRRWCAHAQQADRGS